MPLYTGISSMRITNPCKKCLVQACCKYQCEEAYKYEVFRNMLAYIPDIIKRFFRLAIRDVKFTFRDEPLLIRIMLVMLIICQVLNIIIIIGLVIMLIITLSQ